MYVAKFGRASGQNIVDYYTNLIAEYLEKQTFSPANDLVFIPAGEETSIFGLTSNDEIVSKFYNELVYFVNNKISQTVIIETEGTKISFGLYIYDETSIKMVKEFIIKLQDNPNNYGEDYYSLLHSLRTKISPAVDLNKFNSLGISKID
jgi:hypothetical protein